jgi:tRNA G18 (ribose-2'-O)-methylase SpoU
MHPDAPVQTTSFNVADEYKHLPVEMLKSTAFARQLPFAVALANITGDLNIGVIIRTACVMGAQKVFVFGRKKYDRRSTVGAHHYIDVLPHDVTSTTGALDWDAALQTIRVNGYTPVIIEQGGAPLHTLNVTTYHPLCLVFGAEDCGIPSSICRQESCYSIPQPGILRSLNVSTAAGIAMWHVTQQFLRAQEITGP